MRIIWKVIVRDINGQRYPFEFDLREEFYNWAYLNSIKENCEENEILMVIYCNNVIYSSLGKDRPLDWEELVAWLA